MSEWLWVSLDYATYGLKVDRGRVVEAPPIARWMVGRDEDECRTWLYRKGARIEVMNV